MPLLRTRLATFYAAFFGTIGVSLPFWPVWLESRGLSPSAIGTVLAAGLWARVVGYPVVSRIADARGKRRQLMVVMACLSVVLYSAFEIAPGLASYVALAALVGVTFTGLVPLGDSLTLGCVETDGVDYGRVRLWGSFAFIAASVGAGQTLTQVEPGWILWLIVGGVALTLAACVALPEVPVRRTERGGHTARTLLARPAFVLFLASAAAVQASHAVYYGFGTLHWKAAGHSETVVGLLWAEGVIAEIVLFALGRPLMGRLGAAGMLALGGLAGAVRWTVVAATTDVWTLAAAQLLHAFTFGAAHLGAMDFLRRAVPRELASTAQGIYAAAVMGVGFGLSMPAAGLLFEHVGAGAFACAGGLAALGAALALALGRLHEAARGELRASTGLGCDA